MKRRYEIRITRQAEKDIEKLSPKLKKKLRDVLTEILASDPLEGKRLVGDLEGSFSYRLNIKDRILYSVDFERKIIYVERAKTHYGD